MQEGIHGIILPDLYSSGGSQNLYIDKFGRAKVIKGYTALNASAITTDTGGDAANIVGLHAYRDLSAGGDTRRLRAIADDGTNEWEVHTSSDDGATWSLLKDMGSGAVGFLSDYAQFGDTGFLVNGVDIPQKDDGSSLSNAGGTQSPTITSADSATVGPLAGNYRWKHVSIETDGTRHPGSVASTALQLEDAKGALSWTADADTDVVGYELYRTTGSGAVYYYVDYIETRTTVAYTDATPDSIILLNRVLEEHGDAPPTGAYFVEPAFQRMWYGRTDTDPRKVWPSDAGLPESVYSDYGIDLTDAESIGDSLRGLFGGFENQLVAFQERSIWTISGTGQIIGNVPNWTRTRTNARTGTSTHRSIVKVPAGAVYSDQKGRFQITESVTLAYMTPFGDIRLFDGDNDIIISTAVQETLADLNFSARSVTHAVNDPARDEIVFYYATGVSTTPTAAVAWNYNFGVWYPRTPMPFMASLTTDFAAEGEVVLLGEAIRATGGLIYQGWSGNTFNGTPITVKWMTKTLFGVDSEGRPDMASTNQWRWVDLMTQQDSAITFDIEWLKGNVPDNAASEGTVSITPAGAIALSADGSTIISAGSTTLDVTVGSALIRALLSDSNGDYLYHEGMRLRITSEVDQGQWTVEGLVLGYKKMPGLQRRVND